MSEGVGKKLEEIKEQYQWALEYDFSYLELGMSEVDFMLSRIEQLEKEKAELHETLLAWIKWEQSQIKKEDPYVGTEINPLINNARQVLSKLGGGRG